MALCELAERVTQNRVVALFRDVLGYAYLGDWTDRPDNSNIEEGLVSAWLAGRGYGPDQIKQLTKPDLSDWYWIGDDKMPAEFLPQL